MEDEARDPVDQCKEARIHGRRHARRGHVHVLEWLQTHGPADARATFNIVGRQVGLRCATRPFQKLMQAPIILVDLV